MKGAVLVVREFDRFSRLLNENGFETINLPLVKTVEVEDLSGLGERLSEIENYDGVFLTSPAAARVFLRSLGGKRFDGKIYVLGGRIRRLFEMRGVETVYFQEANTFGDFLDSFSPEEFTGKKFLFPRGDKSLKTVSERLGALARIDEVVVYRTVKPERDEKLLSETKAKISRNEVLAACFFSPSGVDNFIETFGAFSRSDLKIAAIGATTAQAARTKNLKVDFVSSRANAEVFALGLVEYFKSID